MSTPLRVSRGVTKRQHLRLSYPDWGRADGGASKRKKKGGAEGGNSDEKEDKRIHTYV